jgi:hypothetical protein
MSGCQAATRSRQARSPFFIFHYSFVKKERSGTPAARGDPGWPIGESLYALVYGIKTPRTPSPPEEILTLTALPPAISAL